MRISANLEMLYTEMEWEARFSAARNDGFGLIEFWGWEGKDLSRTKSLLEQNGLGISAMSGDGPWSMCDPARKKEYIAYIRDSIRAAGILSCPNLVVHSNELAEDTKWAADRFEEYSDTVKLVTMFDNLKTMALLAEEAGITFVLEPLNTVVDHIGNFLVDTRTAAELAEATGSPRIKVLYDIYHMYLNEGRICETLIRYRDRIGYIHVADAPGRGEPGTGAINYRNVFRHLREIGYEGVAGIELIPTAGTPAAVKAVREAWGEF